MAEYFGRDADLDAGSLPLAPGESEEINWVNTKREMSKPAPTPPTFSWVGPHVPACLLTLCLPLLSPHSLISLCLSHLSFISLPLLGRCMPGQGCAVAPPFASMTSTYCLPLPCLSAHASPSYQSRPVHTPPAGSPLPCQVLPEQAPLAGWVCRDSTGSVRAHCLQQCLTPTLGWRETLQSVACPVIAPQLRLLMGKSN